MPARLALDDPGETPGRTVERVELVGIPVPRRGSSVAVRRLLSLSRSNIEREALEESLEAAGEFDLLVVLPRHA